MASARNRARSRAIRIALAALYVPLTSALLRASITRGGAAPAFALDARMIRAALALLLVDLARAAELDLTTRVLSLSSSSSAVLGRARAAPAAHAPDDNDDHDNDNRREEEEEESDGRRRVTRRLRRRFTALVCATVAMELVGGALALALRPRRVCIGVAVVAASQLAFHALLHACITTKRRASHHHHDAGVADSQPNRHNTTNDHHHDVVPASAPALRTTTHHTRAPSSTGAVIAANCLAATLGVVQAVLLPPMWHRARVLCASTTAGLVAAYLGVKYARR